MRHAPLLAIVLLCGMPPVGVAAQDVEMLGLRYGTRPPPSYYDEMVRDATAFEFRRGRSQQLQAQVATRRLGPGAPSLTLGPRSGPVLGTFLIPVLLGMYSNSGTSPPFPRDTIETGYFGSQPGTITDYYSEVSGGRVTLLGDVRDWQQLSLADTIVTEGESGLLGAPLGGGGAGNFVYELLTLQVGVNWGLYDNDGPDGIANSGDDDGFVDIVAVIHPTIGGECGGPKAPDRIWSHRWALSSAVGETFETSTPAANGGFIKADDYVIQPSISCSGGTLNPIGVFTHELGHAFGLPDLYDTESSNGKHAGVGIWDLMASGSWGCDNGSPTTPCHMGAWSKEALGWANIVTLGPDVDHGTLTLPPVETDGTIYRIDANDGSGEYFLLENRQRIGFDQNLYDAGLLVWHIDPDWFIDPDPDPGRPPDRWESNIVNGDDHMGVWLRQADGLDELGQPGGGRGDADDPFPGGTDNDAFHAVSNPAATSYLGGPTGLTVVDIVQVGDGMQFRLLTRFTTMTVRANGAASGNDLFTVDGAPVDPPATTLVSAPFIQHTIEAVAGEALAPGERRPFIEWSDAPAEPRARIVTTPLGDTEYVAEYGGTQYQLAFTATGGVNGIEPATFTTTPSSADFWFPQGAGVTIEAVPQAGFGFLGWTGALAGEPNPAYLTMLSPLTAGADFEIIYSVTTTQIDLTATVGQDLQLEAQDGTPPFSWRLVSGTLPRSLDLSGTGRITGTSFDLGTFPITLEAVDAIGLPAVGTVTLEVLAPVIPIAQLASPFLLSGPPLEPAQLTFLNHQGNGVAGYDLGDFRAWVLANPSLPMSANFKALTPRTIVLPLRFEKNEEGG